MSEQSASANAVRGAHDDVVDGIRGSEIARTELDEAERLCAEASDLVLPTESRVSQLWLGPVYMDVLLAQGKRSEVAEKLAAYQNLVADCQSPRFMAEAARLAGILKSS